MATTTTTTTLAPSGKDNSRFDLKSSISSSNKSTVGEFAWKDVLIPDNVGKGTVKWYYQRRTLIQYALIAVSGLYSFYNVESPSLRAASLGLLFPGAGLVAVGTIGSVFAFLLSCASIPLVLFAWFGAGGVLFPILLWSSTTALAAILARDELIELAAPVWTAVCIAGITYITYQTSTANNEARRLRNARNNYLINAVQQNQQDSKVPAPGSREADLETLRFLQWQLELGLSPENDFSYHDVIDQFQTSAIRYQLYGTQNDLGLFQYTHAPNFHGYLSKAQRNCIEKSLTQRVVGFWKWESLWGKFNATNWDPIVKDNIMVSGYVLQALGIYQSNTGDDRYCKKGSLEFEVDKTHKYKYDFGRIADMVKRNWDEAAYCLYPCEPNWIYTMCNLVGISGMILADRLLGSNFASELKPRFEAALEEEFTTQDGSILPIRSELTGFTIPGLAGALSNGVNAILCAAYLPHIAHRNWAMVKQETINWHQSGSVSLNNLVGADKIDAGNYKPGLGGIYGTFASAAAEFGDEKLKKELLKQLDEELHPVVTTKTGSLKNKGLSTLVQGATNRARFGGFQDWVQMITAGIPENVKRGPILDDVPFPEVLVAKAYSKDGEGVDLVLYNGQQAGTFRLGFTRLKPGVEYVLGGQSAVASKDGTASFGLEVDGRTAVSLAVKSRG